MEPAQVMPQAILELREARDLLDKRVEITGR